MTEQTNEKKKLTEKSGQIKFREGQINDMPLAGVHFRHCAYFVCNKININEFNGFH